MKKLKHLIAAITLIASFNLVAQVAINTDGSNSDSSAMLDVKSTNKGFLPPRMTETERDLINSPVKGLQIFNTSTNRPNYYNGSFWMHFDETAASPVSIGDFYAGGVIFYIFQSGDPGYVVAEIHGLVCAISDQSASAEWGCETMVIEAYGTAIGTGMQNTATIVADCEDEDIAAKICNNYSRKGYNDWFLPSIDEFVEMDANWAIIDSTAVANGGSAFVEYIYWSSSTWEENDNVEYAYSYWLKHEIMYDNGKPYLFRVRAVRTF